LDGIHIVQISSFDIADIALSIDDDPAPFSASAFAATGQSSEDPVGPPLSSFSSKTVHGLVRNTTHVWAIGRPNVNVVVTGIAAALPGTAYSTFICTSWSVLSFTLCITCRS